MTDTKEAVRQEEELVGEPVTVIATIIAALITASAIAASGAATVAATLITKTGSSVNQAGVLANACYTNLFKYYSAEPSSGAYYSSPPKEVASIPPPETAFRMWQLLPDTPEIAKNTKFEDITPEIAALLAIWIEDTLGPDSQNAISYVMKSTGAGVEGVTVYQMDAPISSLNSDTVELVVVLYLNNPKIGSVEAGGFIMGKNEFIANYDIKDDKELDKVIDYIQENDLYSSGGSMQKTYKPSSKNGPTEYIYCLEFQAAEVATFDLTRKLDS